MITQVINTQLSKEERETHYLIENSNDNEVEMDTTILKDYNRAVKQGWTMVKQYVYEDGSVAGGVFTAPRRCLSVRSTKERVMSEKQKKNIEKMRENKK
jgi:hypothetical protein